MARIGISINEVLRDFIGHFVYTYNKYVGELNLKENDVTNFNLIEFFPFKSITELNKFLYTEASVEVFGHADQLHNNLFTLFNYFLMDIQDDGEHEIVIISREVDKSIPATLFFLAKTTCKATNIIFVKDAKEKWDHCDILITANPIALENKPINKIGVKVEASYNKESIADFTIPSILDFINNESLRNEILNTKIIICE